MPSVLWAGGRRKGPVRMIVAVGFDDFTYQLACGLPTHAGTLFRLDERAKAYFAFTVHIGIATALSMYVNSETWFFYRVWVQSMIITVVMTLLAIPFGMSTGKRGTLYGIVIGIVLALSYWIVGSAFSLRRVLRIDLAAAIGAAP